MNHKIFLIGFVVCAGMSAFAATPLTESTFTEIINQANVVAAATKNTTPARTNEVFKAPNLVRTGPASRVEMTAPDKTVTRIGANSVFTFEDERNIRLEKGSILFHSPAGMGGGAVKNRGTAAAVLGTTMICAMLPDGSFKIMCLEGFVKVTLSNGLSITLKAGEMIIVPPDGLSFGSLMQFNIGQLVGELQLTGGFSHELSSMPLIDAAIKEQNTQVANGQAGPFVSDQVAVAGLDVIGQSGGEFPPLLNPVDHTIFQISPIEP